MVVSEELEELGSDFRGHGGDQLLIEARVLSESLNGHVDCLEGELVKETSQLVKNLFELRLLVCLQLFLNLSRVSINAPDCNNFDRDGGENGFGLVLSEDFNGESEETHVHVFKVSGKDLSNSRAAPEHSSLQISSHLSIL